MNTLVHQTMTQETSVAHVELLRKTVAIQSYSGEEANVATFLVENMMKMGFDSARIDDVGNAVGVRENPDRTGEITQEIVLLGHMDTVKGEIDVRIEDGRLYGRGSVDAKGPLVTFIAATSSAQIPMGTRITVVGAVEEESSTSRGARFAAKQYAPDLCIIGEPSGWDGITIGYKGIIQLNFLLEKPMGHASGLQSGVPERAIEFWNRVAEYAREYNQTRSKLFDQLIPAIRDFNFSSDGLFDRVKFHASVRLPPDFDIQTFQDWIYQIDSDAVVKTYGYETAFRSDRRNTLARSFNKAIRGQGGRPTFKVKTGTCDMNVVGPQWKCPIMAYGPGDSSLDHTPQEHIVIDEYISAVDVLRQVIEAL